MRVFRSVFNGMGSGAGVAWPLFGVVFTLLGGSIGSILSLTLGVISIFLFFTISIAIFYFSYQEMEKNEREFQEQLTTNQQALLDDVNNYANSIYEYYLNQDGSNDFTTFLKKIISMDLEKIAKKNIHSPLYQTLSIISQHINESIICMDGKIIFEDITKIVSQKTTPFYKVFFAAFLGFVGTFGSIAGCSAGVSGLLTGMGVFTSFAAFPLLGWGVIGVALICGIITAVAAIIGAEEEFQNNEVNHLIQEMHRQFEKAIFERDLDTALHEATSAVASTPEEQIKLFSKINKPVLSILYNKSINEDQPTLNLVSFFNPEKINILEGDNQPSDKSSLTM